MCTQQPGRGHASRPEGGEHDNGVVAGEPDKIIKVRIEEEGAIPQAKWPWAGRFNLPPPVRIIAS